ncbi:MAG TPA: hypothetical protein VFH54_12145 [Mycobacteriales bacterium]|nr:hypothetical protein [Mycobacteriales bacterium]
MTSRLTGCPVPGRKTPVDGNGLDLRTWLTVVGLFVLFFGLPAASLAHDRRKRHRARLESAGAEPVNDVHPVR